MPRPKKSVSKESSSESIQFYKNIITSLPNFVYLLDKNCTLIGCNNNFLNLLGLNKLEDALGTTPYKKLLHATGWSEGRIEALKRDDIKALLSNEPIYNANEPPVNSYQGEILYYLGTRIPLINEELVTGLLVILVDNTAAKQMEEQLEHVKEQLQESNIKIANYMKSDAYLKQQIDEKKPPKVLMVEDNSIAQKAAQVLLMQLDCHVDVADSGDQAIALFKAGKYDLVFMDISLEDTSGYIVSKKIRQFEQGTEFHVPIIALTGYEADIVQYDCVDYSMEGALTKPLTSEQAKQIIQHYIYHIDVPVVGLKALKGPN